MASVNDIFNRPPTISEDTLQYTLYLPLDQSDRVSATALAALLTEHAQSLLPGHLWHRDAFELKVAPDPEGNKEVWVLEGLMRVGDCIDDEWAAVWVLRELSRKFDVVVSAFDSDGEFLLIEAAEELPSWVNPTNAENRVWIHNSRLHLVPLSHVSPPSSKARRRKYAPHPDDDGNNDLEDNEDFITAVDAVKLVRDPHVDTTAPRSVHEAVWRRIDGYPAASRQHMHVARAYVPEDVAKALAVSPLLVQKAVETFYTRDGLQLRAAQKMSRFPPEPAVLSSVKMTRTAYAQLVGQKFHPPRIFGRWQEPEGSKEWRWRDVGMKIACGFEMLYQESKNRKDATSTKYDGSRESLEALKDSLRRNPEYIQYIQRLVSAGYFKSEVEGSQLWIELENRAAAAFVAARRDDDASRPSFANAVQTAVGQYTDDRRVPLKEEDSDDWLNVDATDFDAMLEKTVGAGKNKSKGKEKATDSAMDVDNMESEEDRVAKAQAERLRDLAKKVEEFVEGEGDVDGARFADEAFSDDEGGDSDDTDDLADDDDDDDGDDSDSDMDQDEPRPPVDVSKLTDAQRAVRQAAMDRLVPALDPSEYGQMPPAFHSNSQRVAPPTAATDIHDNAAASGGDPPTDPRSRPIRPPILPRDEYDGVDSDDETDEDPDVDEEEEEDHPQVVGEVEIDMADEEEEFIEFARQALGVSDEQWKSILQERSQRGAFAPTYVATENKKPPKSATRTNESTGNSATLPAGHDPQSLDSFESVMKAMDAELARSRSVRDPGDRPPHSTEDKGKGAERDDIEAAMEAELNDLLEGGDDDVEDDEGGTVDYQLIKNFLESFKNQGGLSGPVSTLVGRLQEGWTLPRDES